MSYRWKRLMRKYLGLPTSIDLWRNAGVGPSRLGRMSFVGRLNHAFLLGALLRNHGPNWYVSPKDRSCAVLSFLKH